MGATWVRTGTDAPPTVTEEITGAAVGAWPGPLSRKKRRSVGANRRSRRRPTRCEGKRPKSLQRRIEASLTLRNSAASLVLSRVLLSITLLMLHALLHITA